MIRSMTGFGRGKSEFRGGSVTIEIKTVNHKFFDITAKLPNHIALLEDRIKEIVQKKIRRGKANLNLIYHGAIVRHEKVRVNTPLAQSYYHALVKMKKALGLKGEVMVDDLILFPGVLSYEVGEEGLLKLWPKIGEALEGALDKVVADRISEGRALYRDLARRALRIAAMLKMIRARAVLNIDEYRKKFAQRVRELSGGHKIDAGRLAMEVAIFAKNCDISEEITRLDNHLVNLRKTLLEDNEAGKKLDFIAQELHREINTIGSKASDFKIAKNVIDIKSEIEKIREQVKNIE